MLNQNLMAWEISGILFIIAAGSLFHFIYPWTGGAPAAGIFFPVNESVWEHLKLGYWSVLVYAIIEYSFIGRGRPVFITAKAGGILVLQLFILGFFYGYHLFIHRNIFLLDIFSYIIGAVLCQVVSLIMLRRIRPSGGLIAAGIFFLVLHAALLVFFTFLPPKLPLFMDGRTKTYGMGRRI